MGEQPEYRAAPGFRAEMKLVYVDCSGGSFTCVSAGKTRKRLDFPVCSVSTKRTVDRIGDRQSTRFFIDPLNREIMI